MKLKFWNIIFIIALFFSCQNDQKLDGNYSICLNGEYTEIYFKQDSMRIASENELVKLSDWKKIEIKNDTLHFETFGEWKDDLKAKIKYVGMNKTELRILESDVILELGRINGKLRFKDSTEFWSEFKNRMNYKKCE